MKKGEKFEHFYESSEDISLVLNSYEDIFSDFDPRPYSKKALSVDFLQECRKASADKKGKIHLKLFLLESKRNLLDEVKIKKRMKEHFTRHFYLEKKEIEKQNVSGFNWFILGCFLTTITALFMDTTNIGFKILINIAHPGGWFFLWEGLGKLLLNKKEKYQNYEFYKKMSEAEISFLDYKK